MAPDPTHAGRDEARGDRFRRSLRRHLRPPRQLSFTPSGKYFVLMTLAVGFGAINTGNNLLFLLLGMMLSLIVASGLLSEAVLRGLNARRLPPSRAFAGRRAPARLLVLNARRWPSLSIEVSERNPLCLAGPLAGQRVGPVRVPWWKFWRSAPRGAGSRPVAAGYCLRVDAGGDAELPTAYTLPRRGRYAFDGLNLTTRFPFSLFEKTRELDDEYSLYVYPAPAEASEWTARIHAAFGDVSSPRRGRGDDFFGLRDYMPGEDQRMVHWKSSARRGELVVREMESQEQRALELCLLNFTGEPATRRHLHEPAFEAGLERIVGLIERLALEGYQIGLRTCDVALEVGAGPRHVERMLEALATAPLRDGVHPLEAHDAPTTAGRVVLGLRPAIASAAAAIGNTTAGDADDLVLVFERPDATTAASGAHVALDAAPDTAPDAAIGGAA